jgi:hypothetical protein
MWVSYDKWADAKTDAVAPVHKLLRALTAQALAKLLLGALEEFLDLISTVTTVTAERSD